ncbi:MAG TPA: hypothetical protein VF141_20430, partial [Chryseolinea sp.]
MKNTFLTLFISFFFIEGYTQAQNKIDSLETVLKKELPDSTRLKVLLELSKLNQYVDFARSRQYTEESLLLAEKLDDRALKVLAYQSKALILTSSGDYSAAMKYDNMSL